jgi:hypothetical protein
MPWIELSQRTEHLRTRVLLTLQAKKKTPQFYFEEKLGLLSDADLEIYLDSLSNKPDNMQVSTYTKSNLNDSPTITKVNSPGNPFEAQGYSDITKDRSPQERMLPEDIRQVRSIGWIRKNGLTQEDRRRAEEMYREILVELWYKHVAETGQTYYPPLQNELIEEYTLQSIQ